MIGYACCMLLALPEQAEKVDVTLKDYTNGVIAGASRSSNTNEHRKVNEMARPRLKVKRIRQIHDSDT
jgi:hypothetical protein